MRASVHRGLVALALALLPQGAAAIEVGKTGLALTPPAAGWKLEQHHDAALTVWHLRAESWDPPPGSGMIAVTLSLLEGDPWPDLRPVRDAAAQVLRERLMGSVSGTTPFDLSAGRFAVAGADVTGTLGLGQAAPLPARARLLVIGTGSGAVIVTAFALAVPDDPSWSGLFGATGMLMAQGPGAAALNGAAPTVPGAVPMAVPVPVPPDPGVAALLQQMQGGFTEGQ